MIDERENKMLEGLNEAQIEAVTNLMGPSLIIAGAGSGKTRVLTTKIANILSHGFNPFCIMALTFTNKAAREMKQRIGELVGENLAVRLYAGTFHSIFLRFIRNNAELLGYPKTFTVYDKSDSQTLVKRCIKELELDDKLYKPNEISSRISECKNNLITPETYISYTDLMEADRRSKRGRLQEIFALYCNKCKEQGVMDFDDILLNMYKLASYFPDAFEAIRSRFQFILVDEYQDTNQLQYLILKELAARHRNITVVGDDAQSIYAFRGARIENILNFQKDYPEAKVFRLERNYRSTQTIVEAANSVILRNENRLTKECYSDRDKGEKIQILPSYTEKEEAYLVAASITQVKNTNKAQYQDFAVLYRTNSQSRIIEEALRSRNIPFKIYQGHSFFDRAEIKSMLSYLRLIMNAKDDEAFKRVINFPSRGIGAVSMERIITTCANKGVSLSEGVMTISAEEFNVRPATLSKIREFNQIIEEIRAFVYTSDAYEIAKMLDTRFAICTTLAQDTSLEGQTRLDNIQEFFNSIKSFVDEGVEELINEGDILSDSSSDENGAAAEAELPLVTLDLYLQNIALISDSDVAKENSEVNKTLDEKKEEDKNRVSLMTVHAAKGLEFPYVYIVGLEENLFPSGGVYYSSKKDIEEERRLFYVALTRAKEEVKLSFARTRMQYGQTQSNPPSRFLGEISKKYIKNPEAIGGIGSAFSGGFGPVSGRRSIGGFDSGTVGFGNENTTRTSRFGKESGYNRSSTGNTGFSPSAPSRPPAHNTPTRTSSTFVPDSPTLMKPGQRVEHERFGIGVILSISGEAQSKKAIVEFEQGGQKTLMLKFAKMKILDK